MAYLVVVGQSLPEDIVLVAGGRRDLNRAQPESDIAAPVSRWRSGRGRSHRAGVQSRWRRQGDEVFVHEELVRSPGSGGTRNSRAPAALETAAHGRRLLRVAPLLILP